MNQATKQLVTPENGSGVTNLKYSIHLNIKENTFIKSIFVSTLKNEISLYSIIDKKTNATLSFRKELLEGRYLIEFNIAWLLELEKSIDTIYLNVIENKKEKLVSISTNNFVLKL